MAKTILSACFICCFIQVSFAQTDSLRQKIENIISSKNAIIGVAIYGIENRDTLSFNGTKHFPMQSVFKFHIALTVLNEIDKGKLSFDQKIFIKKSDLIAESDNNGCDILLRLLGGTQIVDNYIHRIGIKDIEIQANEEEMHKEWNIQYLNWTTPLAAIQVLKQFYNKDILSEKSFDFLWNSMLECTTSSDRIKGQLPTGTPVAHKTGSSGTNNEGLTAATNDIGIVCLPNGKHFAICVFVSNSHENDKTNVKIIADIAKVTWDYFIN